MARRGGVWPGVGAIRCPDRLGAVSRRALGMGRTLGLDLGRSRALGVRALSLWALGERARAMGLGARSARGAAGLCARAGGMDRSAGVARRHRTRGGLVSTGTPGS